MTKGELIKALEPFTDEIELHRSNANKYGEETFESFIQEVQYKHDGKCGRIILK